MHHSLDQQQYAQLGSQHSIQRLSDINSIKSTIKSSVRHVRGIGGNHIDLGPLALAHGLKHELNHTIHHNGRDSSSYLGNPVDAQGKFHSTNYGPAKRLRTNLVI